jgi:hypothetical protein
MLMSIYETPYAWLSVGLHGLDEIFSRSAMWFLYLFCIIYYTHDGSSLQLQVPIRAATLLENTSIWNIIWMTMDEIFPTSDVWSFFFSPSSDILVDSMMHGLRGKHVFCGGLAVTTLIHVIRVATLHANFCSDCTLEISITKRSHLTDLGALLPNWADIFYRMVWLSCPLCAKSLTKRCRFGPSGLSMHVYHFFRVNLHAIASIFPLSDRLWLFGVCQDSWHNHDELH